ncbi:MAG: MFS transporter [Rhodanobacter sp.]|nr:MAG: MFS transporter [Rhodanobacter sp.]TAL96795.1 MAG: MFS transporter [Rhodanobacter sp.]TAM39577.1 MAG: MFS transporter [Rhodanobacter sp.]
MTDVSVKYGSPPVQADAATLKKVALASFIGNFIEWFDYASYAYLATILATVFFPEISPSAGLLATFAVFALSFIIRPIGGIVWGHYGDIIGRKLALSLSIIIMASATFLIAFLPGYDRIGVWAAVLLLLLRLIQGFSASGEYAGAAAFLVEYAPHRKRGLFASIVPASTAAGLLFGSLLVTGMHQFLSAEQMHSYGWRLPFLLALPLGYIGRYIRIHLEDSPKFRALEKLEKVAHAPISLLLSKHKRSLIIAIGVTMLNAVGFYTILTYMPTYMSVQLHVSEAESFLSTTIALVAYIFFIFLMGTLSDRFGRKTMLIAASVVFVVVSVPLFSLLGTAGFIGIILIQIAFGFMLTMNDGTLPCFLAEIFPTNVRYSGFALSFNLANAIFGGTAPFVATWLIQVSGNKLAPAWYLVAAAIIALVAMVASKETSHEPLPD